jgi:hypothetical protein
VYVWNLWVFRHEVLNGRSPLSTSSILSLDTRVDLSLHNYTIFSDLLAHHVVRRVGLAWLAGLLFGFSPMLIARSEIHPSLSAAAPLPLFVFVLFRLETTRAARWAVAGGATLAWAAICDPYYAIYCVILAAWFLWTRAVRVSRPPRTVPASLATVYVLDGIILGLLAVIAGILVTGGMQFQAGPLRVGLTTLYTPNLLLVVAVVVLRDQAKLEAAELGGWCRQRLAPFECPKEFLFSGTLPRTAAGKLDRAKMEEAHGS